MENIPNKQPENTPEPQQSDPQPQPQPQAEPQPQSSQQAPKSEPASSEGGPTGENSKFLAAVAYLIFFVPILAARDDAFAMYHANQGLVLFLTAIGVNIVGTVIPIFGWFLILPLGNLFVFILAILGILTALKGEKKALPVIGGFSILDGSK